MRGHKIVAIIAEHYLTLHARQRVRLLLVDEGKSAMEEVANWADGVRHLTLPVQASHSVRLKGGNEPYNVAEDCPAQNCILAAIDASVSVLGQPTARREAQVQALRYLINFVGDVHMPLHATREGRDV